MKILFIITGFGDSEEVGGATIHTLEVAKRLDSRLYEIHFLTTSAGEKAISRYRMGCKYHIIRPYRKPETSKFSRLTSYISIVWHSLNFVSRLPKFDIVITNDDYFCETIPAYLYKLRHRDCKWVAYAHEPPVILWYYRFLKARRMGHKIPLKDCFIHLFYYPLQLLSFFLFKLKCDKILVIGTESDLIRKKLNLSPGRVDHTSNGVDFTQIESVKCDQKVYDACFLGGDRPSKGIYDLLPIWKKVVQWKKDATLIVIGIGEGMGFHYDVAREGLVGNIVLEGYVADRRKIFHLLKSSKVFVFPSHKEGWAIPITEAMACGLPVVAWGYSFYHNIYEKGIKYVPLGRVDGFAEEIEKLLTNDKLYLNESRDARDCARSYSWESVARRELEVLNQLSVRNAVYKDD